MGYDRNLLVASIGKLNCFLNTRKNELRFREIRSNGFDMVMWNVDDDTVDVLILDC